MDKLKERQAALTIVLRGGVAIEGDDEQAEQNARIVYDWLVRQKEEVDEVLANAS